MDVPGKATENLPVYQDILEKLPDSGVSSMAYGFTLEAHTEGPMLVKGIAVDSFGQGAPDQQNIKNAAGEYIIPGSSFKGALRNRVSLLAGLMDKQGLARQCFGAAGTHDNRGSRGCVTVRDIIVGGKDKNAAELLQHRIHIDKFTGGVINSALFSEKTISGKMIVEIYIRDCKCRDEAAGMVLLALRDLAAGAFNLGSGYSIGYGFLNVEKITMKSFEDQKESVIDMINTRIESGKDLIARCLGAVDHWEGGAE